eukprot:PhF_6_TR25656/c1_g1_i1/m.36121
MMTISSLTILFMIMNTVEYSSAACSYTTIKECLTVQTIPVTSGPQVNYNGADSIMFRYDQQGFVNEPLPIYSAVTSDGVIHVAYTDSSVPIATNAKKIHVVSFAPSKTGDGQYVQSNEFVVEGSEVRGFDVDSDGWLAILIRERSTTTYPGIVTPDPTLNSGTHPLEYYIQNIRLSRYKMDGTLTWTKTLEDRTTDTTLWPTNVGRIHDFNAGDARLVIGERLKSRIAVQYKVSTGIISTAAKPAMWHEGDTLKIVNADTGEYVDEAEAYTWGCSHSMETRLTYNQIRDDFAYACMSDANPAKGLVYNSQLKGRKIVVQDVNADGSGRVDGGLGAMIPEGKDYYIVATVPGNGKSYDTDGTDVYLYLVDGYNQVIKQKIQVTNTPAVWESHSHVARYGFDKLLVAWREGKPELSSKGDGTGNLPSNYKFKVAVVDISGTVGTPVTISPTAFFPERDDFVTLPDGSVAWVTAWLDNTQGLPYDYNKPNNNLRIVVIKSPDTGKNLCGNGLIDVTAGESCDDTSACCDKCQIVSQCSPPGHCCSSTCLYKPASTSCTVDGSDPTACAAVEMGTTTKPPTNCGSCEQEHCVVFPQQNLMTVISWCPLTVDSCNVNVFADPQKTGTSKCQKQPYTSTVMNVKVLPEDTLCSVNEAAKTAGYCKSGVCSSGGPMQYPWFSKAYSGTPVSPITSSPAGPLTSPPSGPGTSSPSGPVTSPPSGPVTSSPSEPVTSPPSGPVTSSPSGPSTSPSGPGTSSPSGPGTSSPSGPGTSSPSGPGT